MSLQEFLNQKPINYAQIDYSRMPRIYNEIKNNIILNKAIHIIGTNGKGSTGRFLALMIKSLNKTIGHYTSPHIFNFNERIWVNGKNLSNEELEIYHLKLQKILTKEQKDSLSFFEYMTFLCALSFEKCDEIILEAGLGGEFDATNVLEKKLSIITPIGFDHERILGKTIREIAKTKIRSINTTTLISFQNHEEVYEVAKEIAKEKKVDLIKTQDILTQKDFANIKEYSKKYSYIKSFEENLSTAYAASKILNLSVDLSILEPLDLEGRFQKLQNNLIIDVGHNPMAAKIIASNLNGKNTVLIFNSFEDKDFRKSLEILEPKIKEIQIFPLNVEGRKINHEAIIEKAKDLGLPFKIFNKELFDEENYLVFGSFFLVEAFLKWYNER